MKITGPNRLGSASRVRRSGKTGGGSKSFSVDQAEDTKESAHVSTTTALTAVDSLLALQEVDDPTTGRARSIKRAHHMLDLLEEIRLGLITGGVSEAKLNNLVSLVESRREAFEDPGLQNLIDEIELRAKVEIAKLQQHQKSETI